MATISFVTPEEHAILKQEVAELRALIRAYVSSQEEWLTTEQALKVSGVKTRETLGRSVRASMPDKQEVGRITYRKHGRKCLYARTSCIDYAQRKLGRPTLSK
jgi:hypothetical protein